MASDAGEKITLMLQNADSGSQLADELLPLVYSELRKLAKARMARERPGQTLQATALVHEAYLRLLGDDVSWENRGHFFAAAAEAMRRILIEQARRKGRQRHGGGLRRSEFRDSAIEIAQTDGVDLIDIDAALTRLEHRDEAMANVVKLRYFAGLSVDDTASALDISPRTVNRLWTASRAWLTLQLANTAPDRNGGNV